VERRSVAVAAPRVAINVEQDSMTIVVSVDDDSIREAAAILRRGGLVAFPTETVYGLGANADDPAAVRAMFAAKGRPADHPVIVHVGSATMLGQWAAEVSRSAAALADAFWPGPLTLVVRRTNRASDLVTGGLETVGLRVPGHPVAQRLLAEFGGAIAAPSANRFGRVSPTTAAHVLTELDGRVDLILDGGPCQVGLESTIVDVSSGQPAVLRPGGITAEQVAAVLGAALTQPSDAAPRVSGSLESHYAPRALVELVSARELASRAQSLSAEGKRFVVLSAPADLQQFARDLYSLLRQADASGCDVILATLPPATGIGVAIADRLRKAAGRRD
jgi:L-threonylcarbamoyladenylate synthase